MAIRTLHITILCLLIFLKTGVIYAFYNDQEGSHYGNVWNITEREKQAESEDPKSMDEFKHKMNKKKRVQERQKLLKEALPKRKKRKAALTPFVYEPMEAKFELPNRKKTVKEVPINENNKITKDGNTIHEIKLRLIKSGIFIVMLISCFLWVAINCIKKGA